MLMSFFLLALAIRNVWPQRMSPKAFAVLYLLLLLAGMPVALLSCIPYGLFGIPAADCLETSCGQTGACCAFHRHGI